MAYGKEVHDQDRSKRFRLLLYAFSWPQELSVTQAQERQRMPKIYAARTAPDQKRLETFTKGVRSHLGRAATVLGPARMHMTFMESYGLKQTFRQYGYTPNEVIAFASGLMRYLDKGEHARAIRARIDPDEPLRWMTRRGSVHILALNFLRSEQLTDGRGRIDEYLVNQFGVLPPHKTFEPHMTLGAISCAYVTREMYEDPILLLPSYSRIPHHVALNGLHVYLGRIHGGECPLVAPGPPIENSLAETASLKG